MLLFVRKLLIWLVLLCLALIFIEIYQENPSDKEKPRTKKHKKFVANCIKKGASDGLCDCIYREFQYRFGNGQLHKLHTSKRNKQTTGKLALINKQCQRRMRLKSNESPSRMLKYPHEK